MPRQGGTSLRSPFVRGNIQAIGANERSSGQVEGMPVAALSSASGSVHALACIHCILQCMECVPRLARQAQLMQCCTCWIGVAVGVSPCGTWPYMQATQGCRQFFVFMFVWLQLFAFFAGLVQNYWFSYSFVPCKFSVWQFEDTSCTLFQSHLHFVYGLDQEVC